MKQIITAACVSVALTAFAGLALADKDNGSIAETAVSMEQAIKAVTEKYPGRVSEAELENEDGKAQYEVSVVSDTGESRKFTVDAQSGQVSEGKEGSKHEETDKK